MRPSAPRSSYPLAVLAAAAALALAAASPAGRATAAEAAVDPDLLAGLAARSIGPAAMSGRIAAITAVPGDPDTIWVGAATGGVWRSTDGGLTFEPVFDDQPVAAIGAIAVHPRRPDVVWVGTGEGNPRNSASVGNGVYRSLDGGETWTHLGPANSERVHRILLHPDDPDVAWICEMGHTWGENPERGVFRTDDGGATWEHVLAVDPRTGCADLAADPTNPAKLFAAMWDHRRWPWSFRSGGPGSGLYVSHDGGGSWRRATPEDGLPEGDLGRIGVAVAPSDPRIVYAYVEGEEANGLYRSTDGGRSWRLRTTDDLAGSRPFYYADLRVDPADPDRVYSLWSLTSVSNDGGESFEVLVPFRGVHPDHHAMWIDPEDPEHIVEGNDGGVYESRDHGATWRFVANLPLAQYYHVRVDDDRPYHVYGGLQDNGSWRGPAEVWENGGIRNHHWQEVGFGDGFDTAPVPGDSRRGYAMSQEGHVHRWDLDTGERRSVRPAPPGDDPLRFNWNAALELDPFDPDTLYFGSQFVHRSRDRGESWETISPDLTTDDPEWQRQAESGGLTPDVSGAENFTTLVALAASPVAEGVLWAGSDDGRLHVTRDGGETWTSVEGNLRGVPANTWIPHVEPSPHDPAAAFVVLDNHRRDDLRPYVYRTGDFGRTWKSLATPSLRGYALTIRQDPVDPDLLFLGTEFGLWISLDGGGSWLPFAHGLPTVSVMDLAIQPRENDLVIATHGRSLYVIDDLTPLRALAAEHLAAPLHLFPIAPATQVEIAQTGSSRFPGHGEFRGENEPYGALVAFALAGDELPWPDEERERARKEAERAEERREEAEAAAARAEGEEGEESEAAEEGAEAEAEGRGGGPRAEIVVRDGEGRLVRRFEAPVHRGINRVAWDLSHDAFAEPRTEDDDEEELGGGGGLDVLPGTYQVTVRFGDEEATAPVEVLPDPRFDLSAEDRRAGHAAARRAGELQEALTAAIERVRAARHDVETVLARRAAANEEAEREARRQGSAEDDDDEADEGEDAPDLLARDGRKLLADLDALERALWQPPGSRGILPETDAWSQVGRASWLLGDAWRPPTAAQLRYLEIAEGAVAGALADTNRFFAERVAPFRDQAATHLQLLVEEEPLAMP
ncbi:MAG TPA: hypothetical protein VHM02_03975 [Thermoanaerobaculia bacterium]|nr:hypothetical protein [Thermoanaerobaculia bacterium]